MYVRRTESFLARLRVDLTRHGKVIHCKELLLVGNNTYPAFSFGKYKFNVHAGFPNFCGCFINMSAGDSMASNIPDTGSLLAPKQTSSNNQCISSNCPVSRLAALVDSNVLCLFSILSAWMWYLYNTLQSKSYFADLLIFWNEGNNNPDMRGVSLLKKGNGYLYWDFWVSTIKRKRLEVLTLFYSVQLSWTG